MGRIAVFTRLYQIYLLLNLHDIGRIIVLPCLKQNYFQPINLYNRGRTAAFIYRYHHHFLPRTPILTTWVGLFSSLTCAMTASTHKNLLT